MSGEALLFTPFFLLVIFSGLIAVLAPQVTSQAGELVDRATAGLTTLQSWLAGPPFNLGPDALGGLLDKGISEIQSNSQEVLGVVLGSLSGLAIYHHPRRRAI